MRNLSLARKRLDFVWCTGARPAGPGPAGPCPALGATAPPLAQLSHVPPGVSP